MLASIVAGYATTGTARADDVRDVFGLKKRPPPSETARCDDGLSFACAMASDPLDPSTPYALSTWLPASAMRRLPIADSTHDAIAGYALGARTDGAGLVFAGASGLENRWTIDGAPADSIRTGAAETRLPMAFLEGLLVSAGGFSARDRASTGGTIDARLRRGTAQHQIEADVWTTLTTDARERPIAAGSYAVRRVRQDVGPRTTASLVATGPLGKLAGGTAWYAAGVAPTLSTLDYHWRAARLVDADNDGVPDGLPGDVVTSPVELTAARARDYAVPAMARLGLDRGVHHVELSLVGSAQRATQFLANSTLQAAGIERQTLVGDAIATWRGEWPTTRARLQLAWHHSGRTDAARDGAAAGRPQLLAAYIPTTLADDPVLAAACDDTSATDPAPAIANCQVPFGFFASGGAGQLTDITADRPSITADVAHRIGNHVLRVGATFEDSRQVTTSRFTGDELQFTLFPGELTHRRFYRGECIDTPGARCDYVDESELTYRTIYAAAYAEDSVALAPGLTVDGGVRWELMWVGSRLHFSNEIAPRLGIAWDVLGNGRSRLWASMGRTYALLPAGLGATVIQRDSTVDDFELNGVKSRAHSAGGTYRVVPGLEPIQQDEVTLGGEIALVGALRASAWVQERFVRRGLETTSDGLDNPGRGEGDLAATRESELLAFQLEMAARDKLTLRSGVTWGRTVGTWSGPYDPRQGANLYNGTDWNAPSVNQYGPLPTDLGGHVFIEAERRGQLGPVALAVATRLTAGSGTPRNVLANGAEGLIDLLPRGAGGRNPVLTQANLRIAAAWRGFTATLEITNLFNRREATATDEIYTDDPVRPIQGGDAGDLLFLKTPSGQTVERRTSYQLPTAFQPPLSVALGIHKAL